MAENTNKTAATPLTIDAASLAEIIKSAVSAAVAEARKPTELEQQELEARRTLREAEKRKIEVDQQSRRDTAQQQKAEMTRKHQHQKDCLHEGGRPVHPFSVFVHDPIGGYVLCQKCQVVVRPETQRGHFPQDYKGATVFDSVLFSRLFQKTSDSGIFA